MTTTIKGFISNRERMDFLDVFKMANAIGVNEILGAKDSGELSDLILNGLVTIENAEARCVIIASVFAAKFGIDADIDNIEGE